MIRVNLYIVVVVVNCWVSRFNLEHIHLVQQNRDYTNSSDDCSIRVFCQQVYVLLEYLNASLYVNEWASLIHFLSTFVIELVHKCSDKEGSTVEK